MSDPMMLAIPYGNMGEKRSTPRYDWPNEKRADVSFVILQYTLCGQGAFEIADRTYPVLPGHALLAIPPEPTRYYYPPGSPEPWEFRWLNFYGEFSVSLWRDFRQKFGPVPELPLGSPAERLLVDILKRVLGQRHPDAFLIGELAYQFYLTWWRQLQEQQPLSKWADPVIEAEKFCAQHFRRPLAVKEMADHVGMTREHFTRLFRAKHRMGPASYLRALRLREARRLRKIQPVTLAELAMQTGFSSARQLGNLLR